MTEAVIRFYDVVLAIHVIALVIGFGPTFGYPVMQLLAERSSPRSLPAMWRTMATMDMVLVTPGAVLLLLAGIYLVVSPDGAYEFSEGFVGVGLLAVIVVLGALHGVLSPSERRLANLAERDIGASGSGEVALSDEYWALSKRWARLGGAASAIILVAVFFMVVKP
jgi:uncharacterized membrane protein